MSGPFGSSQWMYSSGDFYGFEPTGSIRFGAETGGGYLSKTFGQAGTDWTLSAWVKRSSVDVFSPILAASSTGNPYYQSVFGFQSSGELAMYQFNNGGSKTTNVVSTAKFRDVSAWYHVVCQYDEGSNVTLYVNGEQVAQGANGSTDRYINKTTYPHYIGNYTYQSNPGGNFHGYMAELYFVDGSLLEPTDFAESKNGVWMPKDAKGDLTFGSNGFYLPFNSTVTAEGQSTVLYEGTGANRSVEGFGYKPDMIWLKDRSNVRDHMVFDRVRGVQQKIAPNDEYSGSDEDTVRSFNSDGITVGDDAKVNASGAEYAAWAWDAGADQTPTGFGCVKWQGSSSIRPVRDVGFTPDVVWIKSLAAQGPNFFDSVRGANLALFPDGTGAEFSDTDRLISFDSDGFTLGSDTNINNSSNEYVAWCWNAGDGDAASNTDGDITSTVKASDTHGFSIGTFTKGSGTQTVGHGLSAAPDWLMVKRYSGGTGSWAVYHSANTANPETDYVRLNSANGTADDATFWGDTAPTSSVFSVGSAFNSGEKLIFYAWTEKSGYSKFSSYTGSGTTGKSITGLGFRPAWLMIKRTDAAGGWHIFDNVRFPLGTHDERLEADNADAQNSAATVDLTFDSDGFTINTDFDNMNADGGDYIYIAFAGGLDTIAPVNTDGAVDSRVKASDDTGFSVVRYQGNGSATTVGHGLSSAPDWFVVKRIDASDNWVVYHTGLTDASYYLTLDTTNTEASNNVVFNSTDPTTSVFSVGTSRSTSGADYIAYCWTATTGKSAFGSYTGTGSSGKSITNLGFRPALIIIKSYDNTRNWVLVDDKRGGDVHQHPNTTVTDQTGEDEVRFDSDGFTLLSGDADSNQLNFDYIYMAFADGRDASFFHDESGQDNHFEPDNVHNSDVVPDSPTNNFCTMSQLHYDVMTFAEGNLKISTTTNNRSVHGTIALPSSGKWIYEFRATDYTSGGGAYIGFSNNTNEGDAEYTGDHGIFYQTYNGGFNVEGTVSTTTGYSVESTNFTADGDMHTIAIDVDNQKLYFAKNGNWRNDADPAAGTGGLDISSCFTSPETSFLPCVTRGGSYNEVYHFNFGQDDSFAGTETPGGYTDENDYGSFKYPVPAGFLTLCTQNLPDPAINPAAGEQPEDYFNTVLYTGDDTTSKAITGVGFQPDFTWIKARNTGVLSHGLFDSVRGANKTLFSDVTNAESSAVVFPSFDSDGFTVSDSGGNWTNDSFNYVAWNWLAGGTAVSNTDGSITASVSANTKAGFSIAKYTGNHLAGATVGHGLNSAPELVIIKNLDATEVWSVSAINNTYGLILNDTDASSSGNSCLTGAASATTLPLVEGNHCNQDGAEHIAYCFHSVPGYSLVSSYTGNNSSDGAFVHCGFSPAFILGKSSSSSGDNWYIFDNKRDTENVAGKDLNPDSSAAEADNDLVDFLSNGFKWRTSSGLVNDSTTFIFIAFAEMPFKFAQGR